MDSFYRGHMTTSAEPGTLVGPNWAGEILVARPCVHDQEDKRDFWTASSLDIAKVKVPEHEPRSLTEIAVRGEAHRG